jgi:hypothetical protein
VRVNAETPEEAQRLAEERLYRVLDRSAKRLGAVIGLDNVTAPDSQENLLAL